MSISPFSAYKPSIGETHYDTATGEMRFFDGTQWVGVGSGLQGVSSSGSPGMQGVTGPSGFPGPTVTVGPIPAIAPTATKSVGPEWEPFFAVWPRRTISGKLGIGPIMRRTQVYTEYTDFSSVERITITRYATKKEAFVWKMKYHG